MLRKTDKILNLLTEYFIKLNFNRKKKKFKKIHKNNFVYFFNDQITKEIDIHGIYEKDEINFLSSIIKRNSIIIDIGANIGNHSIAFSKMANKVYSFEAHPQTFEILKINCCDYRKIKIYNIGISNKKGFLFFKKAKTYNVGGKKLTKTGTIKSKINKLDNLIKLKKKIELIKIDIEGHEYKALLGMKKLLENNNSKIYIEFYSDSVQERRNIVNYLLELGYTNSYYLIKEKDFFKKKYLNLFMKIFSVLLFNTSTNKTEFVEIDPKLLIKNDIKSNILFSKKKISIKKNL